MKPADFLTTAATFGTLLGTTTVLTPFAAAYSLKDPREADKIMRLFSTSLLKSARVRVDVEGLENLPESGQFILVSNHQSHFDGPVILSVIKRHLRFVAKSSLFKIPIFGQGLAVLGNLRVDRSGSDKDRATLAAAADEVRKRVSIVFFAEGTRSDDGVLKPFKKGAALLALAAQVPIVPFAVSGTRHILPKGGRFVQGDQRVAARIGKPISTEGLTDESREKLTQQAHAAVAALLADADAAVANG